MKVLSAVAWPYANGPRHIGHVAGFGVPSDVFSRYMRMAGHDVLMVSGTVEHDTPILVLDAVNRLAVDANGAVGLGNDRRITTLDVGSQGDHAAIRILAADPPPDALEDEPRRRGDLEQHAGRRRQYRGASRG